MRRRRDQPDARRGIAHARDVFVHLAAGQLPALAGLRALRHLDLQIVRIHQVFDGDAEAARGDLLDRGPHRIAVRQRLVAIGLLAAFAGVRLAADAVHRDRQRGVRLARDRAEAHRAGGEPLHDRRRRLHFVKRHRRIGVLQLHQPAQRQQALALVVDQVGECGELRERVAARRMLQFAPPSQASRRVLRRAAGTRSRRRRPASLRRAGCRHTRCWCRCTASRAISSNPAPSIVLAVPVKHFSTKSLDSPTASKICAPQYD